MPAIIVWEGSMPGGKSGHEVSQVWVQTKHAKYLILFGLVRQFNGHDWHLVGTQNEPTADFPVLLFCITLHQCKGIKRYPLSEPAVLNFNTGNVGLDGL